MSAEPSTPEGLSESTGTSVHVASPSPSQAAPSGDLQAALAFSVKELKLILKRRGVSTAGLVEKVDLAQRVLETGGAVLPPAIETGAPIYVKDEAHYDQLLKDAGDMLVVIDFFATWCGPCKAIEGDYAGLANTYQNAVFLKVDVDELQEVAARERISAMPTFVFYKSGSRGGMVRGADIASVTREIRKYL